MSDYETKKQRAELEADFDDLQSVGEAAVGETSTVISVRLRGSELATVEQAASVAGVPLSTFIRQAALATASSVDVRALSAQAEAIQDEARKLIALLRGDAA